MSRFHRILGRVAVPHGLRLRLLCGGLGNFSTPGRLRAGSTVLGLAGVSWLVASTVAPQAAIAYTARTSIPLVRQGDESFETFLRRAEAIARAATQRTFDSDILATNVSITILGQNSGAVLPVLVLNVSRPDWRKQPDPQRWARYFPNASILLGFEPLPRPEEPPAPEEPEPPEQPSDGTEPVPTFPGGESPTSPPGEPVPAPSEEEPIPLPLSPPPPPRVVPAPPPQ
jgi:hypothetical protein